MADWPVQIAPSELVVVGSPELLVTAINGIYYGTYFDTVSWPAANRAMFIPFPVYRPTTFYRLACYNGTAQAGDVDMGLYDEAGVRLVSIGSTAQSGTLLQEFDITDTTLNPGWYYLAIGLSSGAGAIRRVQVGSAAGVGALGMVQMASAVPLPATATYARISSDYIPWVVASGRATL